MKKISFLLFLLFAIICCSITVCAATTVTVTFDADGGVCSVKSKTYTTGTAYGELPTCAKAGYDFVGWADGNGNMVTSISLVTSATVLKAVYTPAYFNLYFDANGGYCAKVMARIKYGTMIGTLPAPSKEGYVFCGWSLVNDVNNPNYIYSYTYMSANDMTVYAIWTPMKQQESTTKTKPTPAKKSKGKLTISFQKVWVASGYQVQYATNKKMSHKKTYTQKKNKNKFTISSVGITKGKTYYVRVRAYKNKSNGKKIYGKWSSKKKIKAK